MNTVRQLLDSKPHNNLLTITPDRTTYEALQMMAEHDVGAVLVLSEGELVGVLTEREYARRIVLQGKTSRHTPVRETMNREFKAVKPEARVSECMELMMQTHTRYLPVVEGSQLIGLISVGDVVRDIMAMQSQNIEHLERYITGSM